MYASVYITVTVPSVVWKYLVVLVILKLLLKCTVHFCKPKRGIKQCLYIKQEFKKAKRMTLRKMGCMLALMSWMEAPESTQLVSPEGHILNIQQEVRTCCEDKQVLQCFLVLTWYSNYRSTTNVSDLHTTMYKYTCIRDSWSPVSLTLSTSVNIINLVDLAAFMSLMSISISDYTKTVT
jgi:hypothetical protein